MANNNVTITEYATAAYVLGNGSIIQVPQEPPLAEQSLSVSGTSGQTAAFNASTTLIRIANDGGSPVGCTIGANPTATVASGGVGSGRIAANQTEFRGVPKAGSASGLTYKAAFIQTT